MCAVCWSSFLILIESCLLLEVLQPCQWACNLTYTVVKFWLQQNLQMENFQKKNNNRESITIRWMLNVEAFRIQFETMNVERYCDILSKQVIPNFKLSEHQRKLFQHNKTHYITSLPLTTCRSFTCRTGGTNAEATSSASPSDHLTWVWLFSGALNVRTSVVTDREGYHLCT